MHKNEVNTSMSLFWNDMHSITFLELFARNLQKKMLSILLK